jgi:hypothetical protein
MKFRGISFWEAVKAGSPLARYVGVSDGFRIYFTEKEYRAVASEMDGFGNEIKRLRDAKTDAEAAVAVYRGEAEESNKRADFDEDYIILQDEEIGHIKETISARDREASAMRTAKTELEVRLSNTRNGNGHFDFLRTHDLVLQRYAADFLRSCLPKERKGAVKVYDSDAHNKPRQFDRVLDRLKPIPYLTEIHWHGAPLRKHGVTGIHFEEDSKRYYVSAAAGHNTFSAILKIYTTAANEREANFASFCVGQAIE